MKRSVVSFAALVLCWGITSSSRAVEVLRWQRLPLAVPLVVDQERVVFIDRNVRVGMPDGLNSRLRVQSAGGAIYLRASEPFAASRLQLQDMDSGALILVDVAAESAKVGQTALEPVRIVDGGESQPGVASKASQAAIDDDSKELSGTSPQRATPVPVVLTRYAAQNLYAPLRTVEPITGVVRINLRRDIELSTLLPTLPVRPRAMAAWRLEDYWVTAVKLTNQSPHGIELDPRALQGDFSAATFQHPTLGPAGHSTDTTVVYVVTRGHGLAESLLPRIAPIDAAVNLPPAAAAGQADGGPHEK